MARYIDADLLQEKLSSTMLEESGNAIYKQGFYNGIKRGVNLIIQAPVADLQEVKHGRWVDGYKNTTSIKCSACSHIFEGRFYGYAFCPLCGARMDGKDGEDIDLKTNS